MQTNSSLNKTRDVFRIAGAILLLLAICIGAFAQGPGRIYQGAFPPTPPPSGFGKNKDIWVDTVSQVSYLYTGAAWRESPAQIKPGADGKVGPQGPAGADGVCPTCPPSGGSGPNIGGVRWVLSWAELSAALNDANVKSVNLAADITVAGKWRIADNYNRIKEINGHGFILTVPSTIDTFIVRTYASLTAANQGIDMQLRITNVDFRGSGRSTVCLGIHANYGMKIEGCRFYNFKEAIYGGWTMGSIVEQCYFWENNISINFDYARFTGGSNSASQSNHSVVKDCKFRHSAGQFGAIRAIAVSGLVIDHCIFEGVQAGPQYEVFFDDNSSTVVKDFKIQNCHIEQQPSVAGVSIRLKDGFAYVSGVYSQYDCTLIRFESGGYAKCIVQGIPYLTSGTKFENVNGAGRWKFIDMPATFDPADATKWNGTPPTGTAVDGWQTNGQTNYLKGIQIK